MVLERERVGLVFNERDAWPGADELSALGPRWMRTIVYDLDRFAARLQAVPPGVGVIALLNSETLLDAAANQQVGDENNPAWETNWTAIIDRFAAQFGNGAMGDRPLLVECLNEWDIAQLDPNIAVAAVRIASARLRDVGIGSLLGSVAGGEWVAQLGAAVALLSSEDRDAIDGVCFHPYFKKVGGDNGSPVVPAVWSDIQSLADAVGSASAIVNADSNQKQLPLWLTEFGLNRVIVDGDDQQQADYIRQAFEDLGSFDSSTLAAACLFCWNDRTGAPGEEFGLRATDDTPHAGWQAFADSTAASVIAEIGADAGTELAA